MAILLKHQPPLGNRLLQRPIQLEQVIKIIQHEIQHEPTFLETHQLGVEKTASEVIQENAVVLFVLG